MFKHFFLLLVLVMGVLISSAQIQVATVVGNKSDKFKLGYGGFLHASYAFSKSAYATLEAELMYFPGKGTHPNAIILPLKAGIKYTLDESGRGFYVEPQFGLNFHETEQNDAAGPFKGFTLTAGAGYLFKPNKGFNLDLGLRYESLIYKASSINYVALRLAHEFILSGKKKMKASSSK